MSISAHAIDREDDARLLVVVSGLVQGVGFRPFVSRLAGELGVRGHVFNRSGGVELEIEGNAASLDVFLERLERDAPELSAIEAVRVTPRSVRGERGFKILSSDASPAIESLILPDVATCDDCIRELFDPGDPRYGYPFINCTACGPRLTIVEGAPYDRERTSMQSFELCALCRAEYEDPTSRRFHAQAIACALCGPHLLFVEGEHRLAREEALSCAVERLAAGAIVAVKGIGGFHLVCDAENAEVVERLRARKRRPDRPFALMVSSVERAEELADVSEAERALLLSPARPIVLLKRRAGSKIADAVAPRSPELGVMLPYAPLSHLLLRRLGERPLVMTSGNLSEEPIAKDDAEAFSLLGSIADAVLTHDRAIKVRCDDSVARVSSGSTRLVRRSRGYAPRPTRLSRPLARPALALGGQTDVTFALGRGRKAFLSHHAGDLEHLRAYEALRDAVLRYEKLFSITPEIVAHDLHPDYASTRLALELARERGLELVGVQHHHAHVVACMVEHGVEEPVIGVAFDGTGYGSDGTIWGGEFLLCELGSFRRLGHLRAVPLPGGDRAIREPWRMALSYARDAGAPLEGLSRCAAEPEIERVSRLLAAKGACSLTSSAGRLFDAVSALAGVRRQASYEGQPAVELEWASPPLPGARPYSFELAREGADGRLVVDTRPLVREVVDDVLRETQASEIARRFHATLASVIVESCSVLRDDTGIDRVALGGGVFANTLLSEALERALPERGFTLFVPKAFPPGDGGLSLGQLGVVSALAGGGEG
jgi:hydrogenase maturation protein HypF